MSPGTCDEKRVVTCPDPMMLWRHPALLGCARGRVPPVLMCQVPGCPVNLDACDKPYCKRRLICPAHLSSHAIPCAQTPGVHWRFCQQCGRIHPLSDFEEGRRSCRRSLLKRRLPPLSRQDNGAAQMQEHQQRQPQFMVIAPWPAPGALQRQWQAAQAAAATGVVLPGSGPAMLAMPGAAAVGAACGRGRSPPPGPPQPSMSSIFDDLLGDMVPPGPDVDPLAATQAAAGDDGVAAAAAAPPADASCTGPPQAGRACPLASGGAPDPTWGPGCTLAATATRTGGGAAVALWKTVFDGTQADSGATSTSGGAERSAPSSTRADSGRAGHGGSRQTMPRGEAHPHTSTGGRHMDVWEAAGAAAASAAPAKPPQPPALDSLKLPTSRSGSRESVLTGCSLPGPPQGQCKAGTSGSAASDLLQVGGTPQQPGCAASHAAQPSATVTATAAAPPQPRSASVVTLQRQRLLQLQAQLSMCLAELDAVEALE